tara:strand:- start:2120 stop:2368 length:249 start_codon:yes stop_codon:yes gene_type:complete
MGRRNKKYNKIKTLDLHGLTYDEAEIKVLNFILKEDFPIQIVTGNSDNMRNIVKKILSEYNFHCHPQYWYNEGCLVITEKKV